MKRLWLCLLCLVLTAALLPTAPVEAATFGVGDTIKVVSDVHVRTDAGTSSDEIDDPNYTYKGVTLMGMLGTILEGPKDANEYTWWRVNFGPDLYEGWCIEAALQKTSDPPSPMVRGIDVSHHQGDIDWTDVYHVGIRFAYVQAVQGASNKITQIPAGTEGTVLSGGAKTKQDGITYTWWEVDFTSFELGWVADAMIEKISGGGIHTLAPGDRVRTKDVTNLRSSPEIAREYASPNYEENMRAIAEMKYTPIAPKSREFYYGSYFFARPCLNLEGDELEDEARAEAQSFITHAGAYLKAGYLQPMLDLEDATPANPEWGVHYWDDDGTPVVGTLGAIAAKLDSKLGEGTTKERLSQWALAWIDEVEEWGRENGRVIKPIVYFNASWTSYFNEELINVITENGIWVANYADIAVTQGLPYQTAWGDFGKVVNHEWDIWQYCEDSEGSMEGISTKIDLNYYNGTLENLRSNLLIGNGIDVFMLVDLSGSFSDDLPYFKAQAPDLMATLKSSYPDVRFGLGKYEDYPIWPFGSASYGDKAYEQLIDLTYDTDAVLGIIAGLYTRSGADWPQSQLVALYQAATGAGQDLSGVGYPGASIPEDQQATFRDKAIKLFILWTDAPFHRPGDSGSIPYPGPSFDETVQAILALDPPMVIGISSGGGGLADLRAIAAATNAVAPPGGVDTNGDGVIDIPEGEPLVASIGHSGQEIAAAIEGLVGAAVVLPIPSAGGPYTGKVGETIVFDGSGSFDPDGWIVLYEWDFESDGVFDFSSAGPTAEYAYTAEFSGVVTLRVTDNDGNTATGTAPVEILLVPSTYKFEYSIPDPIVVASDVDVGVTFMTDEEGDIGYDDVRFRFEADGPGTVTFRATDSEGVEHTFTNSGYWGPNIGFYLPAAYNESTTWTLNFGRAGNHTITFSLIEAPDGDVIAGITETVDVTVKPVEAAVTIDPETLDLQAPSKWITAYIGLPEEYAVEDIDIGTVQLLYNGDQLDADWGDVQDGVLMVKFDRATVAGWFDGLHDEEVELRIAGEVSGIQFEGTAAIRVIDPPWPRRGRQHMNPVSEL